MKQDPGGHTDRGTVDRQASEIANYWENTKCSTEESEASKLLQEHSLPYSRPSLLLLVWEVLFNDFHQPIGHPSPKNKTKLYNTGIYCYLFL